MSGIRERGWDPAKKVRLLPASSLTSSYCDSGYRSSAKPPQPHVHAASQHSSQCAAPKIPLPTDVPAQLTHVARVATASSGQDGDTLCCNCNYRVSGVCASLNGAPAGPERVRETLYSGFAFACEQNNWYVSLLYCPRGVCLQAELHSQMTTPVLRWLRLSQDCLLLPNPPALELLPCPVQSRGLGELNGFFNACFSITWVILPGLAWSVTTQATQGVQNPVQGRRAARLTRDSNCPRTLMSAAQATR